MCIRDRAQIASKIGLSVSDIEQIAIWGNHSSTQYPDLHHALFKGNNLLQKLELDWYHNQLIPNVQQRGAKIIEARGASSAASAANAAIDHMRDWVFGTSEKWVSMGVYSNGSYGISKGIIYSFPCTCSNGEWSIVENLQVNKFSNDKMRLTEKELQEEKAAISNLLNF